MKVKDFRKYVNEFVKTHNVPSLEIKNIRDHWSLIGLCLEEEDEMDERDIEAIEQHLLPYSQTKNETTNK